MVSYLDYIPYMVVHACEMDILSKHQQIIDVYNDNT